jgi:DNA repair protein RadA/Sms
VVKKGVNYRCGECGYDAVKWVGRGPECQAWGTLEERGDARPAIARIVAGVPSAAARPIGQVDIEAARARPTGVSELDRVLGVGLVPGAVVLLAGEPGVGKSTLLLEVAYQWAVTAGRSLYVTGEESAGQVRLRAERTGNVHDQMYLAAESDLAAVFGHVDAVQPGC